MSVVKSFFQTINTPLDVMRLDLSSLKSVRKFTDEFKSRDWFVPVFSFLT